MIIHTLRIRDEKKKCAIVMKKVIHPHSQDDQKGDKKKQKEAKSNVIE